MLLSGFSEQACRSAIDGIDSACPKETQSDTKHAKYLNCALPVYFFFAAVYPGEGRLKNICSMSNFAETPGDCFPARFAPLM